MPSLTATRIPLENIFLLCTVGIGVFFMDKRRRALAVENDKHAIPAALKKSTLGRELEVAVNLALAAGRNMYAYCDEKGTDAELKHDLGISEKGRPEDFCTKVDIENETLITEGLLKVFPNHKIIGEESIGTGEIPKLTKEHTWIIDPIDGTTNFSSGLPLTCVSVGLCMDGKPVLGVVYAPMTDELYLAVSGYGAYRNGVQLAKRQESQKSLVDSIVCFEMGYAREKSASDKELEALRRIVENGYRSLKSLGSGVLDLCYVATGRLDVVYAGLNEGSSWKPWDYCAGLVIVKEVGCAIESIDQAPGGEFHIYADSVICAVNTSLVKEIRKCIKG
jgi:fructose-1,6-bisphosphatase/inositol monophosphatase family enzyme